MQIIGESPLSSHKMTLQQRQTVKNDEKWKKNLLLFW